MEPTPATQMFDVLIVGGGSAGSVLASRLSEDPGQQVLLLEAGRAYTTNQLPPDFYSSYTVGGNPQNDWGFKSEPGEVGHPINLLRGKLLGGSSAVNAAVAARGLPADYDRWEALGNADWGWQHVLPEFIKLENDPAGDPRWHGTDGPFPVRQLGLIEASPMGRLGTVEDVANLAEFFASDLASFVNGQHLLVNGGAKG